MIMVNFLSDTNWLVDHQMAKIGQYLCNFGQVILSPGRKMINFASGVHFVPAV
jgi:hypothetical protein